MPHKILHVLKAVFGFRKKSVYAQVATVGVRGPSLRTMRLYDITPKGQFVFLSHTKGRKWQELICNPPVAICFFDRDTKIQIIVGGLSNLHTIDKKSPYVIRYWRVLDDDDKKIYSGPAPNTRFDSKISYRTPKDIPDTFGVIVVDPNFLELLEVSPDYLLKSRRMQFRRLGNTWKKARFVVG